ncbi:hypothetical protein BST61_g2677 [Cercospora zeina]
MSSPTSAIQLKRRRKSPSAQVESDSCPVTKRRKANNSPHYPPRFWDTLSEVRLTRRALQEFDRRCPTDVKPPLVEQRGTRTRSRLLRSDYRRLKQLAREGGPDLSRLRGYSNNAIEVYTMSQSSSQSRKRRLGSRSSNSSSTSRTRTTTPYSGEFRQKLVDQGIYPTSHRTVSGCRPPKPDNIHEIRRILCQPRPSLSPSRFTETAFEDFQDANERATSESKAMMQVIPVIAGSQDRQFETAGDVSFTRLKKFDPDLSVPKPDVYYGAKPDQLDRRVRQDLEEYIIPSGRSDLPAVPNFFLEGKSAAGRPDIAQNQAMYDGAVGARGMLRLQNYGQPAPTYDGNAYTVTSTYHPGTGTMQMYATHPQPSVAAAGEPQYYMTQLDGHYMIGSLDNFRKGAAAYRNARDWAQEQRDRLIASANAAAQTTSTGLRSFSRTKSEEVGSSIMTRNGPDSATSADELATTHDVATKRRKRPNSPSANHEHHGGAEYSESSLLEEKRCQ